MDAGGWVLSVLVTVLIVALLVAAILWLVRSQAPGAPAAASGGPESAREILDRRLAAGEIDEDEYQRRRAALADQPPPPLQPARG